jgi:hypothetical protein
MTYVGNPLDERNPKDKEGLANKMKELHLTWNVLRHRNNKPNYSVYLGNGTKFKDNIYVIDFGSNHYKIIGPPPTLPTIP